MVGHTGPFVIVVSCVTKNKPHYAHPYKLVRKDEARSERESKGYIFVVVEDGTREVAFPRMGIQCVLKKDIQSSLRSRSQFDPFKCK